MLLTIQFKILIRIKCYDKYDRYVIGEIYVYFIARLPKVEIYIYIYIYNRTEDSFRLTYSHLFLICSAT